MTYAWSPSLASSQCGAKTEVSNWVSPGATAHPELSFTFGTHHSMTSSSPAGSRPAILYCRSRALSCLTFGRPTKERLMAREFVSVQTGSHDQPGAHDQSTNQ